VPRRRPRSVPAARAARHHLRPRGGRLRVRHDLDAAGPSGAAAPAVVPSRVRVLVVSPSSRVVRGLLERRGYLVVAEVDSGAKALAVVHELAPHAALVDVRLPDANGFELAARLTDARPMLSVLLTSADFDDNFRGLAEVSGARGFVPRQRLARADLSRFWPGPRTRGGRPLRAAE